MTENKSRICLTCKWMDVYNAQCFDGHLQYQKKCECEGYEHSNVSAKFKFELHESILEKCRFFES